jgi:hypothetical protein
MTSLARMQTAKHLGRAYVSFQCPHGRPKGTERPNGATKGPYRPLGQRT